MDRPEPLQALPDLTLSEAASRWGVSSANTIKARAAALGVQLRRESSTRTVWPAADVPLGDRLAQHLANPGATLRNFPEALPAVMAPAAGSDGVSQTAPFAPGDGGRLARPRSLPAATDGSEALAVLAQLLTATPAPAPDPLAVARGLAEAAELGAWLSTRELAQLLGVAPSTVRRWSTGHQPRPGYALERRDAGPRVCWWRISASSD